MNIIVLYSIRKKHERKTLTDSVYCFSRYDKSNNYYYLNIFDVLTLKKLERMRFIDNVSAVIIHYSAIAMRNDPKWWQRNYDIISNLLNRFKCVKIIIPQDEYNYTTDIQKLIMDTGIDVIYTCAYKEDYDKLYPKYLGYKKIDTVFTGYIDEESLQYISQRIESNKNRTIDIGYRARKLPYWLGIHGQLKTILAEEFIKYLESNETGLVYDINNTTETESTVFTGTDWIDFLLNCRTMLGCLGGSGLVDWDGKIEDQVDKYVKEHPDATYEDCEKRFFPGRDNEIHLFALSPRHFECAMTKTCQLLVEGSYGGVLMPGRDYIEIKKDFSNIDRVIEKVKDKEFCEKIAQNCYENIVQCGEYTYKKFVEIILSDIMSISGLREGKVISKRLPLLDKVCKMSHIEAIRDYGFLNYKLIKAGKNEAILRLINPRYIAMRIKRVLVAALN